MLADQRRFEVIGGPEGFQCLRNFSRGADFSGPPFSQVLDGRRMHLASCLRNNAAIGGATPNGSKVPP
jgi:hypothetical protein